MVCGRSEVGEPVPGGESLLVPVNQLMHAKHKVCTNCFQHMHIVCIQIHIVCTNTLFVYANTYCVHKYTLCV